MLLPAGDKDLISLTLELIAQCRKSLATRTASYEYYHAWIERARLAGSGLGLANVLYAHIDRLQSHLFSPVKLRFSMEFDNQYDQNTQRQGVIAARAVSTAWRRRSIDLTFSAGVQNGLYYGAGIQKILFNKGDLPQLLSRLVAPWQFGVYNESVDSLEDQECLLETTYLAKHEVWRRVCNLPDAEALYKRIISHGNRSSDGNLSGFLHTVISTATLDTTQSRTTPMPGGVVLMAPETTSPTPVPEGPDDVFAFHELWCKNDQLNDYTTIQLIEPDILICPRAEIAKRSNLFVPGINPYVKIQPNQVSGNFWGRSEAVDLIRLQETLTDHLDDLRRLMSMQFEKLLAFTGFDGITDEMYAKFRNSGFISASAGSDVKDLTSKVPEFAIEFVNMILALMDRVAGFENIMSGRGDENVRSGVQTDSLMKMGSPRLRDRALIVERQCELLGDKSYRGLREKQAKAWLPRANSTEIDSFLLRTIPEDGSILVDSHSSSPIYEENHQQLVAFLLKAGVIGGDSALELLNMPNLEVLLERLKELMAARAEQMKMELAAKAKPAAA